MQTGSDPNSLISQLTVSLASDKGLLDILRILNSFANEPFNTTLAINRETIGKFLYKVTPRLPTELHQRILDLATVNLNPTLPRVVEVTELTPSSADPHNITRFLADGGIGRVWVANDEHLGREVVLKQLLPKSQDNSEICTRFVREAQITGQLQHPNIVPVYSMDRDDSNAPFYTMRYIRGESFSTRIQTLHEQTQGDIRSQEFHQVLEDFICVCNAVSYAHSQGIAHCDLKPENIAVGQFGEVTVIDWGLAHRFDLPNTSQEITEETISGTPNYLSPEQAQGVRNGLTAATDVYSLGAMLFEILFNRPPRTPQDDPSSLQALLNSVIKGNIPHAVDIAPRRARLIASICDKCLATLPADRYTSVDNLVGDLYRWRNDDRVYAAPNRISTKVARAIRRHRRTTMTAISLLIVATILSAWFYSSITSSQELLHRARNGERQQQSIIDQQQMELVNAIATAVDARRQAEAGAELAQLQTNASAKAINEHQLARQLAIAATEQSKTQQRKATLATTEADRQSEIAIRNRVSLERVRAETEGLSFQRQLDIESGYTSSAMQIAASGDFQTALTWANLSLDHAKVIGRDPIILSEHQIRIMAIRSHLPKLSTYLQFSNTPLLTSYSTTTKAMAVVPLRAAPQETAVRTFQGNALKKLHSIKEVGLSVTAMVFSPNGQYLVIAGTADVKPISSELLLISMSDASMERITLSISGEVVALAATNNKIAIGTSEGALNTYVFPDMKPHRSVMAHLDPITTISLSPDLLTAATGSDDRTAKLWELDTLTPSSNAMLHTSAVIDIHFSKTRKEVVTTAQSGHSYSWDTSQFSPSPKMAGGPDPSRSLSVSAMAHHPTGLLFALGTENGAVRIFNAPGSDFIEPLLLGSRITVLSFSKDARLLLIGTAKGTLSVYDFSRRQLIYDGVSHLGAISSLSLSANNQYVTVVTTAGQILSWDLAQTSLAPTELVAGIKPSFLRSNASQSAVVFVTNNTFLHELNTETQFRQLGAELDFQVPIEDVVLSAYTEHGFVITQRVAHPITTSPLKMSGSQIEFAGQIIDVAIADDGYYALSSADRTITIGKFNDESHKSRITAHKLPARFVRFTDDSSKLLTIGPGADNLGNRLVQVISTPNNTVLKRTVVPFDIDSVAATLLANSNDLVVATSQGDVWKLDVNTLIVSRFDDSGFSTRSIVSHGASDFILARDDSIVELVSAGSAPTYRSDFQTIHTSYHEGYDWLLRANDTQFSIQSAKTARQISPPITVPGEIRETLLVVKDERPLVLIAGDDVVYQYSAEANVDPTSSTLLKLLSGSRLDHQKHQVKLSHSDIANMLSDNEFRSIYTSNPLTWLRRYSTTITPAQWRPHIDNLLLRLSKLSHTADTAARKFVIADLIYALLSSGDHKGAFDLLLSNDDIKSTYRAVVLAAWIEDLKLYDQALRQLLKNANPRVPQHFVYLLTGLSLATHDFPVESLMKSLDRLPDRLAGNSLVQRGQLSLAIFRNDKLMALEVLANSPKSGLPLPLKIYFEMARNWTSPKGVTSELLTQFRHQLEVLPAINSGNPGKNWDERCLLDILFRRLQLSNTAPQNGAVNEQD